MDEEVLSFPGYKRDTVVLIRVIIQKEAVQLLVHSSLDQSFSYV
jgi:hypothetical protein